MSYTLEDFYKHIAPDVRGCPMPTVEDAARDSIRDFCQRTSYWRMWLDDQISVYKGDETVELELPDNTRLVDVLAIQELDDRGVYGDYLDKNAYVYAGFELTPQILFNEPATETFDARVRVALKPDIDYDTVEDWVYEDFRDAICHGALSRLLNMSSQPWYRQADAFAHKGRFDASVSAAIAHVALELVNTLAPKKTGFI